MGLGVVERWETRDAEADGVMQKIGQLQVGCWGDLAFRQE